jgi:predicted DNA-binding transcriptional regulator AlpA
MTDDELLTTNEVGKILRKPVGTIRQWRHRGYGPKGFRLGGSVVYRRSAVEAWIRDCENLAEVRTA